MNTSYDDQRRSRGERNGRRARPTSPSKKDDSLSGQSRRRGSSPEPPDFSSRDGDDARKPCRSRIYRECEEPVRIRHGDGTRKDAEVQVASTDIQRADSAQTGESLCQRRPELPRRSLERSRCKKPRKCRDINSDCQPTRPQSTAGPQDLVDEGVQCDPRDICSTESVQTGPSLCANGPFCRFDYQLRKAHPKKDTTFEDCECPRPRDPSGPCSVNKYDCSHFRQQVCATDIAINESSQTWEHVMWEPETALKGRRRPPPYRKVYRNDALLDCECPDPPASFEERTARNFAMQVKATNICPSKQSQTDPCLKAGVCLKGRLYKYMAWQDCACPSMRDPASKQFTCSHFGGQVNPTDICDCEETQTGSSLCQRKPFRRDSGRRSIVPPCTKNRTVSANSRNFHIDDCARPRSPLAPRPPVDACTQVNVDDISKKAGVQTNGNSPRSKVKKCFVRGGPWSC